MHLIQAVLLGIVQGLTEFLPVSSSAHLVIFQHLFGFNQPELLFDVALHFGTLFAVFAYYRKEIRSIIQQSYLGLISWFQNKNRSVVFDQFPDFKFALHVLLASIPTALIGFAFKDYFEAMFGSAEWTSIQLIMNAGILWLAVVPLKHPERVSGLNWKKGLLIGVAQGIAIVPGISRSGITIVTALWLGMQADESVKFSFFLSIVAILGAGILEFHHTHPASSFAMSEILLGSFFAFGAGWLSIVYLLKILRRGKFHMFAYYCLMVGIVSLIGFRYLGVF